MQAQINYKVLLLFFLIITAYGCESEISSDDKYKQVYYDCYHVSQDFFKQISKIDYKT